jgi:superfamily I DNA and/or RNA helicase
MAIFNKKNNESKGSSSELDDVFFDNRKNKKEKEKEVPHEIDETLSRFVKKLSGYYCQFLETDFKKGREPKRKFANKDSSNRKVGIRASKYPQFQSLLHKIFSESKLSSIKIKPRQYKSNLSIVVKQSINASIDTLDMSPLEGDFSKIYDATSQKLSVKEVNVEEVLEGLITSINYTIDQRIVSPVIDIIAPIFEKQTNSSVALDQLESYTEEITTILMINAEAMLPTAIAEFHATKEGKSLSAVFAELKDVDSYRDTLKAYFEEFVSADIFAELRELIVTEKLSENLQFYFNIGEVKTRKSIFPIYSIPASIRIGEGEVSIIFDTQVYANKKAVDFIIGNISKEQNLKITNPITDRIFYKTESDTFFNLANITFHNILVALQVNGDVLLTENNKMSGKGASGVSVTNELSISLSDKSDESIVNDYEAMMTGLEGGAPLLEVFSNIIDNFLTSNPVSIEREIDNGWDKKDVTDRLVFMSPLPLAEEQRKILSAIKNQNSKFISVEGPPGTGKSHTIAAIAFEMILNGKNILILSDKKEALDVVENKIEQVLSKVRAKDTSFVNPILRLGKTGSNYSNIIKQRSIAKLKIAQRSFQGEKENFDKEFNLLESQLKIDIEASADIGSKIETDRIFNFYDIETDFLDNYPGIEKILDDEVDYLGVLQSMQQLAQTHREKFAELFLNENETKLEVFLELYPAIEASLEKPFYKLLKGYPKINLNKVENLTNSINAINNAKGILGYAFSKNKLAKISLEIENIVGKSFTSPQDKIEELFELSSLKDDLSSVLSQYGLEHIANIKPLKEFLITNLRLDENERSTLRDYLSLDKNILNHLNVPHAIKDLLLADSPLLSLLEKFSELDALNKELKESFNAIPDFDYLRDKTQLEALNSQLLANTIDERVINFATDRRTEAKELEKIIKSKGKFPTDKFEALKEAFPCIIAGLRDFAEYIPLEADLFDLVIIDEASQVSIAQALPAILRAKKMIVMGDRKQYSNVKTSTASKELNQGYFDEVRKEFEENMANGDLGLMTRFGSFNITNSVMDFFEMVSNFQIQLRKHFRGYPEMISFSSEYFYDNFLQVLKIRGKPIEEVIEFIEVDDLERLETIKNVSLQETEKIIEELDKLIEQKDPPSVAIITPFSAQQKFLSIEISKHENAIEYQSKLKLAIFTFDTCQGEERDIIMYSMVASRQADGLNYIFPLDIRNQPEEEIEGKIRFQRLNVGFSRGKEKLVFITSKPVNEFVGSIGQALRHFKKKLDEAKNAPTADNVDQNSPMEKKLLDWILNTSVYAKYSNYLEIIPQFELGKYLKSIDPGYQHPYFKVDFLIRLSIYGEVHQFIVEYDGLDHHFIDKEEVNSLNWRSYLTPKDVERECILESYGYKMIRVNRFNMGLDPITSMDQKLTNLIDEYVQIKKKVEQSRDFK